LSPSVFLHPPSVFLSCLSFSSCFHAFISFSFSLFFVPLFLLCLSSPPPSCLCPCLSFIFLSVPLSFSLFYLFLRALRAFVFLFVLSSFCLFNFSSSCLFVFFVFLSFCFLSFAFNFHSHFDFVFFSTLCNLLIFFYQNCVYPPLIFCYYVFRDFYVTVCFIEIRKNVVIKKYFYFLRLYG
jgi:hypothetical protein